MKPYVVPTLALTVAAAASLLAALSDGRPASPSAAAPLDGASRSSAAQQTDFTNLRSTLVSPEVSADRRVTLRVFAPQAQKVTLAGGTLLSANGGSAQRPQVFSHDGRGLWTLSTQPLTTPELHNYRLQIDGADAIDFANPRVIAGSGSPNSLVEVSPVDGYAYWQPRPGIARGVVHRHRYDSALGDVRELHVYTPPGYDPAGEPLPVLYLLHGGGEVAASWADIGRADVIMDNSLAEKRARPCLIVMPLGHGVTRGPGDSPATAWAERNAEAFRRDLFESVIPYVERTYRVRTDRAGRALAGLSMGAGQTESIGLRALETFSSFGLFSGGGRDFAARHAALLADAKGANDRIALLFIGVGTQDGLVLPLVRPMQQQLARAGIKHTYLEYQGYGHSWPVWRHMLYHDFLPALFSNR